MASISTNPSKHRKTNKKRSSKRRAKRSFLTRIAVGGGFLCLLGIGFVLGLFFYFGNDPNLPTLSSAEEYAPKQVTEILDRNGKFLGEIFSERRTVIPFSELPPHLIKALVAAEDDRFFEHHGLDYLGVVRALFANIRAGKLVQGGSTITQQLVKTLLLSPERTIRRKVQEVLLAHRLENTLTKEEILYLYLNQIYFGHGRYGVEQASRYYFGKPARRLDLAESALLAGLPQSPARLSPVKHPKRAKARQSYVLRRMAELGFIDRKQALELIQEPIHITRTSNSSPSDAYDFADISRRRLLAHYGSRALSHLGGRIYVSADATLQRHAQVALKKGVHAIDRRQSFAKPLRRISTKKARADILRTLARKQARLREGHSYRALVRDVIPEKNALVVDLGVRRAQISVSTKRYNPENKALDKRFAAGDLIRVRYLRDDKIIFDPGPQAALIAINPQSGDILALVGGYGYRPGGFNRALRARRQPGSAFKPFVYAAALASKRYSPATIMQDAPAVFKGWQPKNFDGNFRGPIRLRTALAHSVNTIAVRLADDIGIESVRTLARNLGIHSPLTSDLSLALGASALTPLELAAAYCAFANGGKRISPRFILKVSPGEASRTPPKAPEAIVDPVQADLRVLEPEIAYIITSMLESVIREGTGRRALSLGRPAAGKTGTTNEQKDAWFVGYTPQLVTVVWVGFDRPRTLGRGETGGRTALPIWLSFMRDALRSTAKQPFHQPPGISVHRIDPITGLLASPLTENSIEEVFISGTEPKEEARDPDEVDPATILMSPGAP